jgi:hypothetical protein
MENLFQAHSGREIRFGGGLGGSLGGSLGGDGGAAHVIDAEILCVVYHEGEFYSFFRFLFYVILSLLLCADLSSFH